MHKSLTGHLFHELTMNRIRYKKIMYTGQSVTVNMN